MKRVYNIIGIGFALVLIAFIMPFGLNNPTPAGIILPENETVCLGCDSEADPLIPILLAIIIPVIAVLGVIVLFFRTEQNEVSKMRCPK